MGIFSKAKNRIFAEAREFSDEASRVLNFVEKAPQRIASKGKSLLFSATGNQFTIEREEPKQVDDIRVVTREAEGFTYPDFEFSQPGDALRADINLTSREMKEADITFNLVSPSGEVIEEPQGKTTVSGEKTHFGLEARIPKDAERGEWEVFVSVNGEELPQTRRSHKVFGNPVDDPLRRYEEFNEDVSLKQIQESIFQVENSGAIARGEDVYRVVGQTGDLGKYQVNPQTLKEWSPKWLGREFTPDEFLADEEAQEEFFRQFLAVVKRLNLNQDEASVTWHRGWGELGTSEPRPVRDRKFREALERRMKEEKSKRYLRKIRETL